MNSSGTAPSATLLQPGTRVGRYEILRPLDSGGMGQLYLARSFGGEGFEKLVALKRIVATDTTSREVLTRALLDEAQLMGALHHPNIAQVYDAGTHHDGAFYAMEYVHGRSVREIVSTLAKRGRGLSLGNALWIARSAAAALRYAHDKRGTDNEPLGIVHRDICPSNIMVTLGGTVKLIDFGIAKSVTRKAHTTPGTVKGNLRYMSPEQYLGMPLDGRSDIFSLGIVLFELTTGTRWLRERDDLQAAQQMLHGDYPSPSERRVGYPTGLEAIVTQALARDRNLRHRDAEELERQLDEFIREQQLDQSELAMSAAMRELFPEGRELSTQQVLAQPAQKTALLGPTPAASGTLRLPRGVEQPPASSPASGEPLEPLGYAAGAGLTQPLLPNPVDNPVDAVVESTRNKPRELRWRGWVAAATLAVVLLALWRWL